MTQEDTNTSETESENDSNSSGSEWEASGTETILLPIDKELFEILHEKEPIMYKKRKYDVIERFKWTSMLAEKIYAFTYLPCAFVFKNAKIYTDEGSIHYLTIRGRCQSKLCGNTILAFLDKKPCDFPCELRIRTKDTFGQPHENVHRPTRKFQRMIIGEKALNEGVGNYTKRQAQMYGQDNKRLPPILPKQNIIRQCKNEYLYQKLGVKPGDGRDVVSTIEDMRYNPLYPGFIQDVKKDKFYVIYSTPNQLISYKRYCKLTNASSKIAIDGTGSIVKPIIHSNGRKSGHVFFYAIVINYKNKSHSVHQLLTESQSTQMLIWWLKQWFTMGAPKPKEANCDSSRALINALSFTLNDQSIKVYIDTMFLRAIGDSSHSTRPAIFTYIRLDVAHFIHMISRWKCVKNLKNSLVKSFYMHCIALMIDCQTVKQFEMIFRLVCIVALNEREDSIIAVTGESVKHARLELQSIIASRDLTELVKDLEPDEIDDTIPEEKNLEENGDHSDYVTQLSPIKIFINDLYNSALDLKILGSIAGAYYCKEFIDEFLARAYEFPIWTASCLPHEAEHATTSYIEQFFGDKKQRSLKDWNNLIRADVFLKSEYQEYNGSSAELHSNLIKAKEQSDLDDIFKSDNNNDLKKNPKSAADDNNNNLNTVLNQDLDSKLNVDNNNTSNDKNNTAANYEKDETAKTLIEGSDNDCFVDNNDNLQDECDSAANIKKDDVKEDLNERILSDIVVNDDKVQKESLPEITDKDGEEKNVIKKSDYIKVTKSTLTDLFNDSDTISYDNWRNKGRISDHDYCSSLNDQENVEPPFTPLFRKKKQVLPKNLKQAQPKEVIKTSNIPENKIEYPSSAPPLQTFDGTENKNTTDALKNYKKGFHFQPKPDVKYQNASLTTSTKIKKNKTKQLLKNGYKPFAVNGISILLSNTCAFDSITQILATAGKDDPKFLLYMDTNANPTMKFISQFCNIGATDVIYQKKTTLLATLFKERIEDKSNISPLYVRQLNMWSSVNEIWQKCFPSSACISCTCKLCEVYRIPIPMVQVNYKMIWENGFGQLQQSIHSFDSKIRCTKCKLNMIDRSLLFNKCICIELDIRMYQKNPLKCKLITFPSVIQLNNKNYMLRGIIEIVNGHFVAYCRRYNDNWRLHDDTASNIQPVQPGKEIVPNAAIYTRID
ncbi:uncharacterized protein LOC123265770 isoform X3 [Cotesia glomerata]|uniref:uncharacterized protein LOC123265770 isoform X2 n=1 Tax=Cotesia glomerata TaxID=32391 RepID=UPI001D028375|nr:uncharacterized protein LOC123265770 isoform X2 [Cotesia glomerata]XP_044585593.1 uncharacterized protein LOC123265770 isoform X3 [Cotesia glomerata]